LAKPDQEIADAAEGLSDFERKVLFEDMIAAIQRHLCVTATGEPGDITSPTRFAISYFERAYNDLTGDGIAVNGVIVSGSVYNDILRGMLSDQRH
jgi:hypothetical protein